MGTTTWVYRNKFGLVLNKDEQVYSVLHQFDHSKQLKRQMEQEYQIFPGRDSASEKLMEQKRMQPLVRPSTTGVLL